MDIVTLAKLFGPSGAILLVIMWELRESRREARRRDATTQADVKAVSDKIGALDMTVTSLLERVRDTTGPIISIPAARAQISTRKPAPAGGVDIVNMSAVPRTIGTARTGRARTVSDDPDDGDK